MTVPDLSQEQVDGMAGGDTLRAQTLAFGVVRNAKQLQRGAARLLSALQQVRQALQGCGTHQLRPSGQCKYMQPAGALVGFGSWPRLRISCGPSAEAPCDSGAHN